MKIPYKSQRTFSMWAYSRSHGRLLLRSVKSASNLTRIDVLFCDVQFLEIKTELDYLGIDEVLGLSTAGITRVVKEGEKFHYFRLSCSGWSGLVIAGSIHFHEDNLEYGQESPLWA